MIKLFLGYFFTQPFSLMLLIGSVQEEKVRMRLKIAHTSSKFLKVKPNKEKGLRPEFNHD